MVQSVVVVRLNSEMKGQFDSLCEQFGKRVNTAFDIFVNIMAWRQKIPFAAYPFGMIFVFVMKKTRKNLR